MQPNTSTLRYRALVATLALSAAATVAYFLMKEESPLVVTQAQRNALEAGDSFATVQGNGERVLHEFVSVDCSYCRKAEPELRKVGNVTIHRHLIPGHSDQARALAAGIVCAADPSEAWQREMQGAGGAGTACDSAALDRNYALGKAIGITGTPALVFPNGRVLIGLVTTDQVEAMLRTR